MIKVGKINITVTSGGIVEKPLVSAFKGSLGTYIVLDNELNGTMGLPIILVSKYENDRLVKINDQNEWSAVKEVLRNIIAGNQVDYVTIPDALTADDSFFMQLTLPIASFEALKANYKPLTDTPVAPEVVEETPVMPSPMPNFEPTSPVMPEVVPNTMATPEPVVTQVEQPVDNVPPVSPVMPEAPMGQTTDIFNAAPVAPQVEPIPEATTSNIDFSKDKEAFLKACENMFDALVAKFNK